MNKYNNIKFFGIVFTISFASSILGMGILDSNLTVAQVSTPIPLGTWNIQSNGLHGTMNITSIDTHGVLQGSILLYPFNLNSTPIKGYYDNNSDKITFVRTIDPNSTDIEVYTGYKFSNIIADCISGTGPGSCYQYATLAGIFQSFTSNQTTGIPSYLIHSDSKRNTFGWYASYIAEPCSACPH